MVTLYDASTAQVGWILTVYNASGFVASLLLPSYADRREDYLRPMLACGVLALVLALVLAFTTSLPVAVVALVVVGGPAGVGSSMLYAHLRHSGAKPADIVNTRAIVSVAWIAGPPVATLIIGAFGNRAILLAIGAIAVLIIVTTIVMIFQWSAAHDHDGPAQDAEGEHLTLRTRAVVLIVAAFVLLQAGNATVMSIMTVFVTETMRIDVIWAGIALGVAAGLEIPVLVLIGRLSLRFSSLRLIVTGCLAGIAYYVAMAYVTGPVMLIALQPLNAWCFAAIAGVGLTLFQQMIPGRDCPPASTRTPDGSARSSQDRSSPSAQKLPSGTVASSSPAASSPSSRWSSSRWRLDSGNRAQQPTWLDSCHGQAYLRHGGVSRSRTKRGLGS